MGDFWVFGYGSLIWNPGFEYDKSCRATIFGLHRSMCVYSWVHRGTQERPGLVLGLDRGGSCKGIAFKISEKNREKVISYLRERELVTNVYLEIWRSVRLEDGQTVSALTYIADSSHQQYCSNHDIKIQIELISGATGRSGNNRDYVVNTVDYLQVHKIRDNHLEKLATALDSDAQQH